MMVSRDVTAVPLYGGLIAHTVLASCAFVSSGPSASLPLDVRSRCAAFARGISTLRSRGGNSDFRNHPTSVLSGAVRCIPAGHGRALAVQRGRLMLARLAHLAMRYRWPMIGLWLFLTVVGVFATTQVSSRWYTATAIPGQPAYEASQRSLHELGVGDRTPDVVVFHTDADATTSSDIEQATRRAAAAVPGAFTSSYYTTGNLLYVSKDRHTAFQMIYPAGPAGVDKVSN